MNIKLKKALYETIMKSVAKQVKKALNESDEYIDHSVAEIIAEEFPMEITTYAGRGEYTYTVSLSSEYDEDDEYIYLHAETDKGFYVDFEILVKDFLNEYSDKPASEIVEWYLIDAVDDEVDSQYMHGEFIEDDGYWDENEGDW